MATTAKVYGKTALMAFNKEIDWVGDDVKVMLLSSAYTPDVNNHVHISDVKNHEISSANYKAGGKSLTGEATSYSNGVVSLKANDITWSNTNITCRYAIVYVDTGNPSTSPLICYQNFGVDQICSNSDFTIVWDSGKVVDISIA